MASVYHSMSDAELDQVLAQLEIEGQALREKHLALDMARGKPSPEQTALSKPMLDLLTSTTNLIDGTVPVDNYFAPDGLPSARKLAAELIGVEPENVIVNGSSSLNLMHDLVAHAFAIGVCGNTPWCQQDRVKFLCPSPGYDRHFTVTAHYGIENIPIPMAPDGPDMDEVCRLVETDPQVKGIWCVPKYSNPQGYTYSDETVRRFAALKPAASDFRIFWDNAYAVHDLYDEGDQLLNIFDALAETGGRDLVYEFASMAKVTFPGSGMAWVAASHTDIADIRAHFAAMRVCPEKISQFAHVAFLHDAAGVRAHMKKHAAVARPRFELVERKPTAPAP
ncbi:MAG TPA: aminotransferase class I/II-fold pyridoxal phosphate-dependent enzyme [Atopobiaceae bacterium]|nr:aminotransferase class I/II-fold pyridoxal phosphate-dependent enzyme [Atopobiaceae bacterium]